MLSISFYSYKGGVGRTLTLANLASYLAQFGARVMMIDFDLEAPGLHYKFGLGKDFIPSANRGLTGFLADVSGGSDPSDIASSVLELDVGRPAHMATEGPFGGRLWLLPAGNPTHDGYWSDLARIDWQQLFASERRPGVAALAELRDALRAQFAPDFLLIDSRTGVTASGGVATTLLPDVVVMMMLNTPEHLDGTGVVLRSLLNDVHDESASVVPVLSRFVASPRRPGSPPPRRLAEEVAALEDISTVIDGITSKSPVNKVSQPFILHSDSQLQRRERLAFNQGDSPTALSTSSGLLDDYLRLFSHIVPFDTVAQYVEPVRLRVRATLMDAPDESVRSLEELASLVPGPDILEDLFKMYILRRDSARLLEVCARLWELHKRTIVRDEVTNAIEQYFNRNRFVGSDPISPNWLEPYFMSLRVADPEQAAVLAPILGSGLIGLGLAVSGRRVIDSVTDGADDELLANIIQRLAEGNKDQEREAVRVALAVLSPRSARDVALAACAAVRYTKDPSLAKAIAAHATFDTLPDVERVEVLRAGDRGEDALDLALNVLLSSEGSAELDDDDTQRLGEIVLRDAKSRRELQQARPELVDRLRAAGPPF